MALSLLLVLASLVIILGAAELFTNAVEWLGRLLGLAQGAVGSVLAAVGTALPETMIPIIAILVIGGGDAHAIGVGAILGAPFLLSTAAFAVTGLGVIHFRRNRRTGTEMRLDHAVIQRDLGYFFIVYAFAIGASFLPFDAARYLVALALVGLYAYYVYQTFSHPGADQGDEEELKPLYLDRVTGGESPNLGADAVPPVAVQADRLRRRDQSDRPAADADVLQQHAGAADHPPGRCRRPPGRDPAPRHLRGRLVRAGW